ncbi:HlyD family efflux transporter periplasmic adaptor subunit [Paludibacterium paludis]|uniref:Peptide zinc metalloprotease protein n=1 Tax=Paludibacterium paludis TaxID=1225769 RepID=A0A918P6C2_9NEIS|nr:HlyD family efflux transporter periplasmic adaptor subunit [Paludibacterium paludis]GGY24801.1 hypothetical protein GCM10011289_30540 [Paludibacterium paludis]
MTERVLPGIRQELTLHPGPAEADGSPSWTLHDPCSNRFYQLGWASFEILRRWHLATPGKVLESIRSETTLNLDGDDIDAVVSFLARHQLLDAGTEERSRGLWRARQAARPSRMMWLLKNYLFFRIPLVRPETVLNRLLPWCAWLFEPRFWWIMGGVLAFALAMVSRRWDEFTHTFSGYGGAGAAIGIGLSLSVAKVLHELGHALTAKRFGCRVPAMGVAFLVMVPVLYTDTNDAWKLPSRRQRLLIGAAGMLAELTLAVWATVLWCFLPDGPLRAGVFLLASTTWLATLAVNASPFMRFDGYFLLSDYLGLPNLHSRAFALALWRLRRWALGLDDPVPEPLPPGRERLLVLFAWATWLYRLVVFLSIAFLVYHMFFKALGLLLLVVELGWFIVRPVTGELRVWWRRRHELRWCRPTKRSAVIVVSFLLWIAVPWQGEVASPAVIGARQSQGMYAPVGAVVADVFVKAGQAVRAGDRLARLESPELSLRLARAEAREREAAWQVSRQPFNADLQVQGPALRKQWMAAQEEVNGLRQQQDRLLLTAPFAGRVTDAGDALLPGTMVTEGEHLLDVVGPHGAKGEAFVDEAGVGGLKTGDPVRFVADGGEHWGISCRLGAVDRLNLAVLDQPVLASVYGGPIPVEQRQHGLVPLAATFRVRLESCDTEVAPVREMAGLARIDGERHSLLGDAARRFFVALRREAGL